ncbi:MAG: cupin domain-containing protein [Spirochaetia bacterium]|jgi:quercetin dioxygenase-like cupin family protein|nr:cupin domain-containing protein [Spirochaetia bacterium]
MTNKPSGTGYFEAIKGIDIRTLVYGDKTLMAEIKMKGGSLLPSHSHPSEQTGFLVSGKIILHFDGIAHEMTKGCSWCIPSDVMHHAEIIEDSVAVEVFSPVREDYKKYHS